ncbi:MAG: metallophosphoesterase family protein [Aminivibrio sp.]|jgi:DNA repair exonuclease SbcCD nuclease subunit
MIKFLHTADWQIGMRLARLGEAGSLVREERLTSAQRAVDLAAAGGAQFILLAGDVFEDNAVDRALVRRVAAILGSAPLPVFVIPGNHDPLVPGSVWEDRSWQSAPNVTIITESSPLPCPGGTLYPCPVRAKQSGDDPTAWIKAEEDGGVHIGLAHGSVEGAPIGDWDHPIPRDAAARSGLDYLALGHWHSFGAFSDAPRMAYSGTHEPTSFGERDSGNALMVEIAGRGEVPRITPVQTGGISWVEVKGPVSGAEDIKAVLEEILAIPNPGRTLLRVSLSGFVTPGDREILDDIAAKAEDFLWSEVDTEKLTPAPEDESWVNNLPEGLFREVAARIQNSEEDPAVRTRALLDLFGLVSEARP